jgi:hypothetical protein
MRVANGIASNTVMVSVQPLPLPRKGTGPPLPVRRGSGVRPPAVVGVCAAGDHAETPGLAEVGGSGRYFAVAACDLRVFRNLDRLFSSRNTHIIFVP